MAKKERIEIRLTKIEKLVLEKKAEKAGFNLSEYIRKCCLDMEIKSKFSDEEKELLKKIYDIGIEYREMRNNASNEEILMFDNMIKTLRDSLILMYDR
ncbi:plasmid mobilization protein [Flavobacterium sp.]|uniref:plasmid mobilization protein n=1 Tax=Flavobacterium sp. TaxID=239 RepID=UPI004047F827